MAFGSDDLSIHRAVYSDAHRRGDASATARAAARLRAHITELDAADLTAVRASRQRFGQAIREARARRLAPAVLAVQAPGIPISPPRRFPVLLAASLALLAFVVAAVVAQPLLSDQTEGGGGGAPAADASDPVMQPITLSRGRVVLAVAAVEPVVEQAAASAEPEPSAAPASSPAPTNGAAAAPTGGLPGGVPGAAGSGAPGPGSGSGVPPSATPTPRPTPRPTPLPPLARGFARLSGVVLDASTGRGLSGACVSLGPCTAGAPRTDATGRWTLDLPVGSGGLNWGLEFAKDTYTVSTLNVRSRTGYIFVPPQFLVLTR